MRVAYCTICTAVLVSYLVVLPKEEKMRNEE